MMAMMVVRGAFRMSLPVYVAYPERAASVNAMSRGARDDDRRGGDAGFIGLATGVRRAIVGVPG